MNVSMKQLHKDMDPCFKGSISLDALGKLHRWGGESYKKDEFKNPIQLSLRDLGHRHSKVFRFLWLNTELTPTIKLDTPVGDWILEKEAPMPLQRASEIAWTCQDKYDCIALCEVWTNQYRDQLLNSMRPPNPSYTTGPGGGKMRIGIPIPFVSLISFFTVEILCSGLLTMNPGPYQRIGNESEKFRNKGDKMRDADAYSNKGILKVTIETGFNSKLEIYSTHLFWGGQIHDVSDEDRTNIQIKQIDQLVDFIQRTHEPSNFIIVAGDFNIDASRHYEELRSRLEDKLRLEDVWKYYAQNRYHAKLGNTEDSKKCQADPDCTEYADDDINADNINDRNRVDYIFVQEPSNSHDINVDIARPRRKHFPRDPSSPGYNEIANLSDHAGIELKLYLSSK